MTNGIYIYSNAYLMFIGQYLGDVWYFDFISQSFVEVQLEGDDRQLLSRSNHTAVYYPTHNS